jgi:hypothetical protein
MTPPPADVSVAKGFHFFLLGGAAFFDRFPMESDVRSTNVSPLSFAPQVDGILIRRFTWSYERSASTSYLIVGRRASSKKSPILSLT